MCLKVLLLLYQTEQICISYRETDVQSCINNHIKDWWSNSSGSFYSDPVVFLVISVELLFFKMPQSIPPPIKPHHKNQDSEENRGKRKYPPFMVHLEPI